MKKTKHKNRQHWKRIGIDELCKNILPQFYVPGHLVGLQTRSSLITLTIFQPVPAATFLKLPLGCFSSSSKLSSCTVRSPLFTICIECLLACISKEVSGRPGRCLSSSAEVCRRGAPAEFSLRALRSCIGIPSSFGVVLRGWNLKRLQQHLMLFFDQ